MSQVNRVSQTGWQIFVEVPGKAPIELPNGESVIGRSRACLVQIAETTVSRQHATFVVEPGKVRLRDLGSSNGTFVNGERVEGEASLADGDRIVVGEAELVFRMLAPLGPSEATARLVIPPLGPPAAASPTPTPTPASGMPHVPAAPSPALSSPPAWSPTPHSRIPPAAAPSPAKTAAVGASAPPSSPAASAAAMPPAADKKGDELLPSIRDIDLAPVPPPLPRKPAVAAPAVAAVSNAKVETAGFWPRVVAALLESVPMVILAITQFVVAFYVSPSLAGIVSLVQLLYGLAVVLVLPALTGTTPAKRLMKLWIVSESTGPGQGLGWKTAALRFVGYLVCSLTFGLGYLLVAFSARKQGLHDLIAKTNVVRKR